MASAGAHAYDADFSVGFLLCAKAIDRGLAVRHNALVGDAAALTGLQGDLRGVAVAEFKNLVAQGKVAFGAGESGVMLGEQSVGITDRHQAFGGGGAIGAAGVHQHHRRGTSLGAQRVGDEVGIGEALGEGAVTEIHLPVEGVGGQREPGHHIAVGLVDHQHWTSVQHKALLVGDGSGTTN